MHCRCYAKSGFSLGLFAGTFVVCSPTSIVWHQLRSSGGKMEVPVTQAADRAQDIGPKCNIDQISINTIRTLAMDAVQQANSGHPGAPMALAPVAYSLWQ